ncbi:MAG: pyridoxamine 5'-phosphate oxidase family protein [Planctomycetota bacterium]|jgi:nitroimidazol reductase NimA-like FMN-containing flavoprotein (pyridoxamine 5'-phosphate oxidase superfamily)
MEASEDVAEVMRKARVCRLALCHDGQPYLVPLCFGHEQGRLYFHTGPSGRKLEMLAKNDRVCFELEADVEPVLAQVPCRCNMRYRSVVGFGRAVVVEDRAEKQAGLRAIMRQYAEGDFEFPEETVARTTVIRLDVERATARQAGY